MNSLIKNQYGQSGLAGFFMFKLVGFILIVLLLVLFIRTLGKKEEVVKITFNDQSCLLDGKTFELQWIHSVEKQWWVEAYEVREGSLLLTDTYFETFGAGSPSMSAVNLNEDSYSASKHSQNQSNQVLLKQEFERYQARQSHLNKKYDNYVHYQVNQKLPYLNWMVSSNVKATIINQENRLPVYQWVSDYTNIYIAPKKISLWEQFSQESCHDYYNAHSAP